jgi:hypothetical protein
MPLRGHRQFIMILDGIEKKHPLSVEGCHEVKDAMKERGKSGLRIH